MRGRQVGECEGGRSVSAREAGRCVCVCWREDSECQVGSSVSAR